MEMTPAPGYIQSDGRWGLRVVIKEVEHFVTSYEAGNLLIRGYVAFLRDPDPTPMLRGEPPRRTGHILASRDDGDEIPHLVIAVRDGGQYLARKDEVAAVRGGTLDICKVMSV